MQTRQEQERLLRCTDIAQPAIGAISLAMARVLESFGVKPAMTCGHSFGELTALCAAGWIDETTFLDLAVARGSAMAEAGKKNGRGSMLAVKAPLESLSVVCRQHRRSCTGEPKQPGTGGSGRYGRSH